MPLTIRTESKIVFVLRMLKIVSPRLLLGLPYLPSLRNHQEHHLLERQRAVMRSRRLQNLLGMWLLQQCVQ